MIKIFIKRVNQWSGVCLYKGCYTGFGPYYTKSGNVYTGLSDADARRLEKELQYKAGTLDSGSSFWDTFFVKIDNSNRTRKGDTMGDNIPYIELDLNDPNDELKYLHALSHKLVAIGRNDNSPGKEFVLINEDEEARKENEVSRKRRQADKEFEKMSMEDMRKLVRLLGKNGDAMSNEIVERTVNDIVEKTPDIFMAKWVNNSQRQTQYLIEAAVAKNIIRRSRNVYRYGTDTIGVSLEDTATNLDKKENVELKAAIADEVEAKSKLI